MLTVILAAICQPSEIQLDYVAFRGLQVSVRGVPIIQGSSFQYYEKNWTRGIFSSNWRPVQIINLPDGTIRVRFQGDNGQVTGTHDFRRTSTGFSAHYEFRWRGDQAVRLENSFAMLWAPAFSAGSATINGVPAAPLEKAAGPGGTIEDRKLGPDGATFAFDSPLASVTATVQHGQATVFDARNYSADWAKDRELLWLGFTEREVKPQETVRYQVDWTITTKPAVAAAPVEEVMEAIRVPDALVAESTPLPLVPKPKSVQLTQSEIAIAPSLKVTVPESLAGASEDFETALWRRWRKPLDSGAATTIDVAVGDVTLPAEGYRLTVTPQGIKIGARDEAGARHGLQTLLNLTRVSRGQLVVPLGEIRDWPTLSWRGVHMFVGPEALAFQSRLMSSVLAPMKFNHVVLQCERTDWKSTPGIATSQTMPRAELATLFRRYRAAGIEPIPLIQSLGHAGWLFANKKNLDIALNPEVPFTVDPRKRRTRDLYSALWTEAIELLRPKTVHFGLDEIDMRGVPADPYFTTRIWKQHVPFLLDLAKKMGVTPMMWGDIMLGPGEAPDAMHAKTIAEAKERRAVLSKGVMIADWHYKDDANPAVFTSLKLWKAEGQRPIASTWHRLGNIRGMALAAAEVDAGLLQTTWAGYESNERNMVREFPQFAAYLVAADYAWSGRTDMPDKLGYDPGELLRRLYFSPPAAIVPGPGVALVPKGSPVSRELTVGPITFRTFAPIGLNSLIHGHAAIAPVSVTFPVNSLGTEVVLAVDCLSRVSDTEPVALVTVTRASGKTTSFAMDYGTHVRATTDSRPTLLAPRKAGLSAVRIPVPGPADSDPIRTVMVKRTHLAAGVRISGITVLQ